MTRTHLRTGVPAELLVDLVDGDGDVLEALAEEVAPPLLHLLKLLPAHARLPSAGLKSYNKMEALHFTDL